ncbi:MAG: IPT/TIG domain-containing protein [Acidobacteria bacterium]|nr:IPT/TIG domain-containing protein [Acidobacteriota bacterium]
MMDKPRIESIAPQAAITGGEVLIRGRGFQKNGTTQPTVRFGEVSGNIVVSSEKLILVRVPEEAAGNSVTVETSSAQSPPAGLVIGRQLADNLHPVSNPAVDAEGNVFITFSGSRGQKTPVSVYKISREGEVRPFLTEMMNPTGISFDRAGQMYVSSRFEGNVYQVSPSGERSVYADGMGVATGIAFDEDENLYVGDRSGTVFKIDRERNIFVFATLEASMAAYHLAFGPGGYLYLTSPTTSSFDCIFRISPKGEVSDFYRGLGRPQGMAFDREDNLYVAASLAGRRGIVRITQSGKADLVISGPSLVGLAIAKDHRTILATTNSVYELPWDVEGRPLLSGS